ncbi:MAG: hypothetical protein VCD00_14885 [Candidatus Hydrogenedentota bacterium]
MLASRNVKHILLGTTLCASLCAALPVFAWGSTTQRSVVSAAGHIFTRNSAIPLTNLMGYVNEGAQISEEEDRKLYLQFTVDPVQAIQREMYLLQGVRTDRIDPYFAYRLGALGKKVVQYVSPMRDTRVDVHNQYDADVEKMIGGVSLENATRNLVEPAAYFTVVSRQAQQNNEMILVDYRSGLGIDGVAGAGLSKDVSRAVDAVADVWFTIFRSQVDLANISHTDMRDFMLLSIEFYVKTENVAEVQDVYARAGEKGLLSPEMKQTIGNLYYDNGYYEVALLVYDDLLQGNIRIPDVNRRIADYHVSVGKGLLADGELESAQEAFQKAADADTLNDDAQRQLVMATREIEKRDTRFAEQKIFNEIGKRAELDAEAAEQSRDYVQAMQYLRDAQDRYAGVTDEFPDLEREASVGLRTVEIQMSQMKNALVANAQLLSGSGFAYDARKLAGSSDSLATDALKAILEDDYQSAIQELSRTIQLD